MTSPTLSFNCALITGGGGGIGLAIASWLRTHHHKKVIIAGRTESKLKEAVKSLGGESETPYYVLDTGEIDAIPAFVEKVTREHPEVDCIINNAGVQKPLKIEEFDLKTAEQEIRINQTGPMNLAVQFLQHFKTKEEGAVIVNVSSVLGYVPFSKINPCYNGTKAWMHFWSMNLRTQLAQSEDKALNKIKVVEIVPPTVATDLHRDRDDPDDNKKEKNKQALSVDEFIEQIGKQWEQGEEVLSAGMGVDMVKTWYDAYGGKYAEMTGEKK